MASVTLLAQHYIECDNCEENPAPAQFLCKTCPGHLCVSCKSEHKRRKISQNHDIIHMISENEDTMELSYCSEHKTKKLECYCSRCQKPVCTQCMKETHNGHKVENLATVYNRMKDELLKKKEEIETTLLPKYEELLAMENEKEASISKRTDEVEKQIEDHTENIIKKFTAIKEEKVQILRQEREKVLESVANSKTEIERRIKALKETKTQISCNLGARPGIIFFKTTNGNSLKEMRRYPNSTEYELHNFRPGNIENIPKYIDFGHVPSFASSASVKYTPRRFLEMPTIEQRYRGRLSKLNE